jgi:FkbM family methyltransferase
MRGPLAELCGHTFVDALGPAPMVLDLGANTGRFSAALVERYPDARLVLVEPDPLLQQALAERFGARENVALFRGIVTRDTRLRVPFHLCRVPEGNSTQLAHAQAFASETRSIEVEAIRLDELVRRLGRPRIALVKMDIEGSEYDVIESLEDSTLGLIDQLSVEFHDFVDPALRPRTLRCIERLGEAGFALHARAGTALFGSPYFDCAFFRP